MAAPNTILFDPGLLQRYYAISISPSWKEVNEALTRLQRLKGDGASPYDEMELDRDKTLQFEKLLRNSADSIAYAVCLAAHLARFSNTKAFEQRLIEGFQALSTGLGLDLLSGTEIRDELQRCVRAAFPDLKLEFPPISAPAAAAPAVTTSPQASVAATQSPAEHVPHSGAAASAIVKEDPTADAPAKSAEAPASAPPAPTGSGEGPSPARETARSAEPQTGSPDTLVPLAELPPTPPPSAEPQKARPQTPSPSADSPPSAPQTTVPSAEPPKPAPDPWRLALEQALAKIAVMDPMRIEDVRVQALDAWQGRLLSVLPVQGQPTQPETPPDINYLRCRAANDPVGTVLHGRLRNVTLREWNEAYVCGMSRTGAATPVPLYFALAALGMLGFDIPRDIPAEFSSEVPESFLTRIPTANATKGLLIIKPTADSQTTGWKISPSVPALILAAEELLGDNTAEGFLRKNKMNLLPYLQQRLHGVLVEVGRDEAFNSPRLSSLRNTLTANLPSIRAGFLALAPLNEQAKSSVGGAVAVRPADAGEAYTQAFVSTSPPGSPTSSGKV